METVQNGTAARTAHETRTLSEILDGLAKPIPARLLKSRRQGGSNITYCPWHRVVKILDYYTAGRWDYEIVDRQMLPSYERVVDKKTGEVGKFTPFSITVRLTIHGTDASAYREGTGYEELPLSGYGDVQSNSESMALRRAAAKFGLGLHLYEKDD